MYSPVTTRRPAASCRRAASVGSVSTRWGCAHTRAHSHTHTHVCSTCRQPGRGEALAAPAGFARGPDPSCGVAARGRAEAPPPLPAYMVPDLSAELLGKSFSVGVTAGLPTPELLLLLERCCTTGRTGRMGGGRSCAPASRADRAGLKVVIISVVELLLRRMAASGSRIRMVWRGLAGSELAAPSGGFFMGSSVSSTTSGACLAVFCRSSSRSSFSAVLMVFSMSCKHRREREVSTAAHPTEMPPS